VVSLARVAGYLIIGNDHGTRCPSCRLLFKKLQESGVVEHLVAATAEIVAHPRVDAV